MTVPYSGGRSRSAAVTSRDSRTLDQRQAACAQMLMQDAIEAAAGGREGLAAAKQMLTQTIQGGPQSMSVTADRVAMGVGIGISAAVGIAGIVVTGGLAIPLLIGLGAGAYALKTLIKEIGYDLGRQNRNWLQNFPSSFEASSREQASFLTCEAGDAMRRAVDHYRMMKNSIIPDLQKYENVNEYQTCEDAINHVKAVARFVHHGDKVRNYILPCIDTNLFFLKQYKKMNETWKTYEPGFRRGLEMWFMEHPSGACSANASDLCYAPRTPTGALPMRPKDRSKSAWTLPLGAPAPESGAIDIDKLIEAMEKGRLAIVGGMHVLSDNGTSYNSQAERGTITRVRAGSPSEAHMAHKRALEMIDAVWKQVDRPNYFNRTTRRMGHWYTRNNKTEKLGAVVSTITDVGSLFMPFLGGATEISAYAKDAIKGGVAAGTAALGLGMGALQAEGRPLMSTALLNQTYIMDKAKEDVRGTGAAVAKLMPDLLKSFSTAAEAVKALQTAGSVNITSCKKAFGLSAQVAELIHEMNKVGLNLMACIGLTDYIAAAVVEWAEAENAIWLSMETEVKAWIATGDHATCRNGNTVCYGSKHHQQGGGLFSRSAVTWHELSTSTPHKALT